MDIRELLRYFFKRMWLVAVLLLICTVLSAVTAYISKPIYKQGKDLLIGPQSYVNRDGKFVTNLSNVISDMIKNEIVDEKVANAAGHNLNKNMVRDMVSAKSDDQYQKVSISVSGGDSEVVSAVAENIAPVLTSVAKELFNVDNLMIIREDKVPYVSNKDYKKAVMSGAFTGIGLGLLAIFIMLLFDDRVRGVREISRLFGLEYLGGTNNETQKSNRNDQVQALSVRIALKAKKDSSKVIAAVDMSTSDNSKLIYDIAEYTAQLGNKVLIIETGKTANVLSDRIKGTYKLGFSDVLSSKNKDLAQVIYNTAQEKLDIMPYGTLEDIKPQFLMGGNLNDIINYSKENYDMVFIDIPSNMGHDRILMLSNVCEGTLLSVKMGRLMIKDVENMFFELKDINNIMMGYYTV